jgi:hypothetical protein
LTRALRHKSRENLEAIAASSPAQRLLKPFSDRLIAAGKPAKLALRQSCES